ncbi:hypothetical protein GU243_08435 [Pseudarthrobacter psychrotolerans]|uniref:Uncharacterized protein n=1 Tax=Pseudarthrobacter psychrotolerans TaxID=2697569 RepID=A0A6P1NSI8_9MICC|nr:hypothetical protein [Pseudarthrobacter psychrotolerans]QHK19751.1 hypothetical protein GU243_08435 [Pseudarthrobacter psychrotolerans]
MKEPAARGRLVRRETHSSRAAASVVTGIALVLILAWAGTEAVLSMARAHPLLVSPPAALGWLTGLPTATLPAGMIAGGGALALAGLVLVLLALLPGTRGATPCPAGPAPSLSMTTWLPPPSPVRPAMPHGSFPNRSRPGSAGAASSC